jgi:hypothetical protein
MKLKKCESIFSGFAYKKANPNIQRVENIDENNATIANRLPLIIKSFENINTIQRPGTPPAIRLKTNNQLLTR